MKPSTAKKLLRHNYDLYEHQALCFSKTRGRGVWEQEIIDFVENIPADSSVLDLGCGNARLYQLFSEKGIKYLGIDPSKQFIRMSQKEYDTKFFEVEDGLTMKFKNKFDYIISISVLHHIPGNKLQLKFLTNCWQALKPHGTIYLVLWNRWQSRFKKYFDVKKPFTDMDSTDTIVPWMHSKYQRYIHLFKPSELKYLAQKTGFKNIKVFASKHGQKTSLSNALNIYLIGEK